MPLFLTPCLPLSMEYLSLAHLSLEAMGLMARQTVFVKRKARNRFNPYHSISSIDELLLIATTLMLSYLGIHGE